MTPSLIKSPRRFEPYHMPSRARRSSPTHLNADISLEPGSTLTTRKGLNVLLGKELGQGGEATVHSTNDPHLVAKIYHPDCLTDDRQQKLSLMLKHGLDRSDRSLKAVCWPRGLLRDCRGTFRGFLQPRAQGLPLGNAVFSPAALRETFPHWSRQHLVRLSLTMLNTTAALNRGNILLGDINPYNILVQDERQVAFVDTDSYQVGPFPCPVGTTHFTPPELQGAHLASQLRTWHHESFAVATLLFMTLMLGKPPYAQRGGESPTANIMQGRFPYALGAVGGEDAPPGPWKQLWAPLPYRLKEAFYECFECHGQQGRRRSVEEWTALLEDYDAALGMDFSPKSLIEPQPASAPNPAPCSETPTIADRSSSSPSHEHSALPHFHGLTPPAHFQGGHASGGILYRACQACAKYASDVWTTLKNAGHHALRLLNK